MTFGEKLQALRRQQKISQETVAEKTNVSRMTISRWESGQALPDIQQIIKLSEMLMVSVDYLMYERIEDKRTSQFHDFQTLRIIFGICIGINICGMIIAMIGWLWVQMDFPVVLGLIMSLWGCVFFEIFPPKGIDKVMMRYTLYAASVWSLLPVPIFVLIEIYSTECYNNILPYLIGGAIYVLTATILTVYLMHQYRK